MLATILDDHGVELAEIEFLFEWSAGADEPERVANARQLQDKAWAMADAFGPRVVSVGELAGAEGLPPFDVLVERFAALCDRAAEHDLLVALEFMPWTGIPDVASAAALVEASERAERRSQRRLVALLPRRCRTTPRSPRSATGCS